MSPAGSSIICRNGERDRRSLFLSTAKSWRW